MLLETGTEEMGHIEMLATAVALNLEGAPLEQDKAADDPMVAAVSRSTALTSMPVGT